jgi:membrane protein
MFPMMLVLIVASSYFLQLQNVQAQLIAWVSLTIPGASSLISQNFERMLALRGAFGAVGIISLLWSATGIFNTLAANISRAWPQAQRRNFVTNRIIALGMLGGLVALVFIMLFFDTLYTLVPEFTIPIRGSQEWHKSNLWQWFSTIFPILLNFLILWVIYWWVPNTSVSRRASLIGALVTVAIWRLFSLGFTVYLSGSINRYKLVYGSLGSIVVLMFWFYLSSWITLYGAHLTAAIDRRIKRTYG